MKTKYFIFSIEENRLVKYIGFDTYEQAEDFICLGEWDKIGDFDTDREWVILKVYTKEKKDENINN